MQQAPSHASPAKPTQQSDGPDNTRNAQLECYFGASGTGKSTSIKRRLTQLSPTVPVVFFDPKHEYLRGAIDEATTSEAGFLDRCDAMTNGGAKVGVLRPPFNSELRIRQFDRFCSVALALARHFGGCVIVADELHTVTGPQSAPAGWEELVMVGRGWGAHILAASQRPQSIDMGLRTNLTFVRSGRLGEKPDCERVAAKLMVPWEEIAALPNLHYIERDMTTHAAAVRGVITF
jgi:hypothetical protein